MDHIASAVVFVNPTAGRGAARRRIEAVRAAFEHRRHFVQIVETTSRDDFLQRVRAAKADGCKTLVAIGGDGTIQLLARESANTDVTIGIIPAGSGNDFAAALKIPKDTNAAVSVIAAGKTRLVDLACVVFDNGDQRAYLGGGGMGLDARAAVHASGTFANWPGRLRYLASAIAALRGFNGLAIQAALADAATPRIEQKVLLAVALNTPTFGGGLSLAPAAQLDDGKLDLVLVDMLSSSEVFRLIPRLLLTGELNTKRVRRLQTASVRLSADGDPWFQGDGELLGRGPVEVRVLPGALRVLVP